MSMMASQITSLNNAYSTIYSGTDQRKHQSSTQMASYMKVEMFPFDDFIMVTNSAPNYTTDVSRAQMRNNSQATQFLSHLELLVTWLFVCEGNPQLYILYVKIQQGSFNQGLTSLVKGATGVIIYLTLGHDVRSLQVALTPCSYVSEWLSPHECCNMAYVTSASANTVFVGKA